MADGLSVYRVDPEVLDGLAPTVVVTQTQCEVCAVSLKDVEVAVCELVGSRPRIVSLEPMALCDVWNDIRAVASALGEPQRGDDLVKRLIDRLAAVRAAARVASAGPSMACIEWIDPLDERGQLDARAGRVRRGRAPVRRSGEALRLSPSIDEPRGGRSRT